MPSSLIRLRPLPFSSLPPHPSLNDRSSSTFRPSLETFLHSALSETQTLVATTIPQTFKTDKKLRSSSPSAAKVQLSTGTIDNEFWVCRRSVHVDAAEEGTATWEEFEKGLRENHSENEMAYTPSVTAVEHLLEWPIQAEIEGGWRSVHMHVNLITHTFHPSALISPRTFISLVISAVLPATEQSGSETPSQGFFTVQIPLTHDPAAQASDSPLPDSIRDQIRSTTPKNTIFASYASVERVLLLPPGSSSSATNNGSNRKNIEWTMATTSDAGGLIPQWVQRSWTMGGVPKAVVADVGLFLDWTARQRKKQ
ncbi:hypothetical protein VTN96DRAFT_1734 [Rasamsonia emersonii]